MELRLSVSLRAVIFLIILLSSGSSENDVDTNFCGTWRHGNRSLSLIVNLSTGCKGISVSANESSLSIDGQITAKCRRSEVIPLKQFGLDPSEDSNFCLYWEPLLDQLKLEVKGMNLTLCWPASLQGSCCTDLSNDANKNTARYGISNGKVKNDSLSIDTLTGYSFRGDSINCKALCDQVNQGFTKVKMSQDVITVEHPCARSFEVEMKEDFEGFSVTSNITQGVSAEPTITVQIPPVLKRPKKTSKVVCTFFKNDSLFQDGHKKGRILDDVVEITVENEVISDLSQPVKIVFNHDVLLPKRHSRKCVSWDTRKDPSQVNWLVDGCETHHNGAKQTECHCNHLTYFSILVQLEPRPVCHLVALTTITYLGCAVSVFSCVALVIYLLRKRRSKEQSIPIHLGLAVSLIFLNGLFFFTGVLANVGWESVCSWVGPGLHYALLSSFAWMGIEIFHTFWLVYKVFSPSPKAYVWNLVGFVLPAVPVIVLVAVGDIYGEREVLPCEEPSDPYRMCWMKETPKALLAHYFTNMTTLVVLVISGTMMLLLVYRQIRTRDEWRQNRVAFLSIWGLSCLFGATWGLTFLDYGPLSDFILFLFCILNSFQGFFLMLRFLMLDWMRKQAGGSAFGSTSTGSTRQHMLQAQEKS
ncbi:adhesion G-protein coupled receptor G1 isoform 1-T2 [Acanthopagrus schlegelii]